MDGDDGIVHDCIVSVQSPFTAIVPALRVETVYFCQLELTGPWGGPVPPSDRLFLHHLLAGHAWLHADDRHYRLGPGDLVLVPCDQGHYLGSDPDPGPSSTGYPAAFWASPPEPDGARSIRRRLGGTEPESTMLCVAMTIDGPGRDLLLRSLPPVVHLPGRPGPDQTGSAPSVAVRGLKHLLAAIRIEANGNLAAAEPMIDRMAELMLKLR